MVRLVLLGVGGIVAIAAALKVFTVLIGMLLALAAFVLFRIVPLILIGWLVVRIWKRWTEKPAT